MYTNILVPVELSHGEIGSRILELARSIGGPSARVTALSVIESVPSFVAAQIPREALEAHWTEAREELAALVRKVDPAADVLIRQGHAATTILEEAERLKVDAIVLGSHRPDLATYLIGSTAARVVRHAQCSVVVDRGA